MAGRELAALTAELRALTAALDPGQGWYAAFARRSRAELDAWLAGHDLPPWDIVADLLQDLAAQHGPAAAGTATPRLRSRWKLAVRSLDQAPGARASLVRRLTDAERGEREALGREHDLSAAERNARAAGQYAEADRLASLRMWAGDDAERERKRREGLRARLTALPPDPEPAARPEPAGADAPAAAGGRKPRGARFAGIETPRTPARPDPVAPAAATPAAPPPAGSRFAAASAAAPGPPRRSRRPGPSTPTEEDRLAAEEVATRVARLRARGESGALYVALCEALTGPARRLPLLIEGMESSGLAPEVGTLLWEAAALPPGPLAAAADALAAAGRRRECEQLLRQGAARPAAEAGGIAAELLSAGRSTEALTLLGALVRARRAEEAVGAALDSPAVLAPLLLDAASRVSPRHHHAISSELRRAGVA